jgi:hypothetical protein
VRRGEEGVDRLDVAELMVSLDGVEKMQRIPDRVGGWALRDRRARAVQI